jgi:hypothetical protein
MTIWLWRGYQHSFAVLIGTRPFSGFDFAEATRRGQDISFNAFAATLGLQLLALRQFFGAHALRHLRRRIQ